MSERKMPVNSSRRVDMHAFVEVGVQVGSRLCSYGSAGRQPRGIAWLYIATNALGQPIVASHRRSWRLSGLFRESHASLSIIEAHLVVKKNVHQYVGTLLHKRKSR
jgi:hypothetical protein